jgi:hypothetical protein
MGKVIRLTESDLINLVKRVISEQLNEIKKDVNEPLWNVYRIPTNIGANGYVISSIYNEQTILGQLIAFAKNKWKEGNTVVSTEDEDGSGYMFRYIITLLH